MKGLYPRPRSIAEFKHNVSVTSQTLSSFRQTPPQYDRRGSSDADRILERFFILQDDLKEFLGMAKKVQKQSNWVGFFTCQMTQQQFDDFAVWDVDDHDLWLMISTLNTQSYKFSTSFNASNDTYVATLTCNDPTLPHGGYSMSAFAPTWYDAVKLIAYKHTVVLDGVWDVATKGKQANQWG